MTSSTARREILKMMGGGTLLLAGGCSALFPAAPPRLFTLRPLVAPAATPLAPLHWKLAVALPYASQALDTTRIALRRGAFEVDYFADAAWPDLAPGMIQGLLIDAIEASGRLPVVQRDTSGMRTDFLLLSQLKDFQAQYSQGETGSPEIHVRMTVQLARSAEREVLDGLDVDETRAAGSNSLDAVILAFDQCSQAVMSRIVAWVLETGQRSYGATP